VEKYKGIIREDKKDKVVKIAFLAPQGKELLEKVNALLQKSISIKTAISDLDSNSQKQNFAREGMKIHNKP
jgi:hypothetical protein